MPMFPTCYQCSRLVVYQCSRSVANVHDLLSLLVIFHDLDRCSYILWQDSICLCLSDLYMFINTKLSHIVFDFHCDVRMGYCVILLMKTAVTYAGSASASASAQILDTPRLDTTSRHTMVRVVHDKMLCPYMYSAG